MPQVVPGSHSKAISACIQCWLKFLSSYSGWTGEQIALYIYMSQCGFEWPLKGSYTGSLGHSWQWGGWGPVQGFGGTALKGGQCLSSRVSSSETKLQTRMEWLMCVTLALRRLRQGDRQATQTSRPAWASLRLSACLNFNSLASCHMCSLLHVLLPVCCHYPWGPAEAKDGGHHLRSSSA